MKSMIKELQESERTYPYLGRSIPNEDLIVFFLSPSTGAVIHLGERDVRKLGEFRSDWSESSFTFFKGTITLANI